MSICIVQLSQKISQKNKVLQYLSTSKGGSENDFGSESDLKKIK